MFNRIALLALPAIALAGLSGCNSAGAAPASIAGSKWAFMTINGQRPVSSRAGVQLDAHRIAANAGCNGLGGDLTITRDHLITGPIIGTQMYCDGVMDQEQAVAQLLGASPRYTVEGDKLTLTAPRFWAELKRVR